jgi:hypothetical protein
VSKRYKAKYKHDLLKQINIHKSTKLSRRALSADVVAQEKRWLRERRSVRYEMDVQRLRFHQQCLEYLVSRGRSSDLEYIRLRFHSSIRHQLFV